MGLMQNVVDLIFEFDASLDDAVGLYLDAQTAMIKFAEYFAATQVAVAANVGKTIEQLNSIAFSYGHGDANNPSSIHLHSTTQGNLQARNARNGRNHLLLGQRFIVDVYTFWEDSYRSKIATAAGVDRNTLKGNIFGDIRLLRNSIIHHRGISLPEVLKCKTLTWFVEGDEISIVDQTRFHTIVRLLHEWLSDFGLQLTGHDIGILKRYGASGHRHL